MCVGAPFAEWAYVGGGDRWRCAQGVTEEDLDRIIEECQGDLRAAMVNLQFQVHTRPAVPRIRERLRQRERERRALRAEEQQDPLVSRPVTYEKDTFLAPFHAVGKICYNRRGEEDAEVCALLDAAKDE